MHIGNVVIHHTGTANFHIDVTLTAGLPLSLKACSAVLDF